MDPPRASQHRRVTKHDSIFDKHRIYIGQALGTQRGPLRRRLIGRSVSPSLGKGRKEEARERDPPERRAEGGTPWPAARVLKKRPTHRGRRSTARHGGVQKVCQSLENFMHGYFHAVMMPPVWRRAVGRASGRTASKQTRAASLDSKLAA